MICKKCKIEMDYIGSKQNGPYHICKECNEVTITSNLDDFGTLDDNELDYISDRGRD
jgi:plastocyanin domain-containing protein